MLTKTILLGCLAWPMVAAAGPVVVVDDDAPFTAEELNEAVQLRTPARRDVRVTRDGDDLVIEVGGAAQRVTIAADSSRDTARVIAMVIVALDGGDRDTPQEDGVDRETPAALASAHTTAAAPTIGSRWTARVTLGLGRDDGGTYTYPLTGALSYAVSESARVVASGSLMGATAPRRGDRMVPIRLGAEGRAGAAGIELGGFVAAQQDCTGSATAAYGGYVAGRVYLPFAPRYRLVLEANAYYALRQAGGCSMDGVSFDGLDRPTGTLYFDAYGGALGAGIEWQL